MPTEIIYGGAVIVVLLAGGTIWAIIRGKRRTTP